MTARVRQSSRLSLMLLAAAMLLISSCASLSSAGVGRIKEYTVESEKLPPCFDGYKVAFISDIHYPSLFGKKRLPKLVRSLKNIAPDILLMGGDYVTDNDSIDALFMALSAAEPSHGTYAVLGNHERKNAELIERSMSKHGIELLTDERVQLCKDSCAIFLVGVRDGFTVDSIAPRLVNEVGGSTFVMLLVHTPDYAERSFSAADLVLSGHTHGGQVSLFGIYTPVKNTAYGTRFLRGRNRTSGGATVITTNGVGTSRKKVRFCVPSEIVVITLRSITVH